jgi:hypothetical protein
MKEDNKIFWKFIQSKTKSKENIPCIMDENEELQPDNKIKAELLNNFFQSVFIFIFCLSYMVVCRSFCFIIIALIQWTFTVFRFFSIVCVS